MIITGFCAGASAGIVLTLAIVYALSGEERATIAQLRMELRQAHRERARWERTSQAFERQAEVDYQERMRVEQRATTLNGTLQALTGSCQVITIARRKS